MVRYWAGHIATVAVAAGLTYVLGEGARDLMNGNLAHLNQAKDLLISLAEYGLWLAEAGYFLAKIPQVQDQEYQLTREFRTRGRQPILDATEDLNDRKNYTIADRTERREPILQDAEDLNAGTRREIAARRFYRERRRPY